MTSNLQIILFKRKLLLTKKYIKFLFLKFLVFYNSVRKENNALICNWVKAVKLYEIKGGILFRRKYDKFLSDITYKIAKSLNIPEYTFSSDFKNILFLSSNIYDFGGHIRVIYDLVRGMDKRNNRLHLFITEIENFDSRNTQYYGLLKDEFVDIHLSDIPYEKYRQKVLELLNYVRLHRISKIVLFEHAWDIVTITGMIKIKEFSNIKLIYYHHQNMHISVFPNICDAYLAFSDDSLKTFRNYYNNPIRIDLPIEINKIFSETKKNSENITFFSAIPFTKMFSGYNLVFPKLVVSILNKYQNARYLIVTKNEPENIELLKIYFQKYDILDRIEIRHSVSDLSLLIDDFDIFIDGIPIGGGKTILEMISLGKPCVIFENSKTIIKQNNSLGFIKVYNIKELYDRVDALINYKEYTESYVKRSIIFLLNTYNFKKIAAQFETIVDNL